MGLIEKIEIKNVMYEIADAQARTDIDTLQTDVDDKISLTVNSSPTAVVDFVNGLKINGALISYNESTNTITFS